MIRTVDLVVAGDDDEARAAAVSAARRGQRVLVVLRSGDPRVARQLRRWVRTTAGSAPARLRIMTGAEVVCADGVGKVEAIVIRCTRSGRLCAVNASAFVSERRSF